MSIGPSDGCIGTAIVGSGSVFASKVRCSCTRIYHQVTELSNKVLSFCRRPSASSRPRPLAECVSTTRYGFLSLKFDTEVIKFMTEFQGLNAKS
jgi:hypothetical protein